MRKYKTSKKNRTNYIYYGIGGEKYIIKPEDANEEIITILHQMDDEENNAQRREDYHVTQHYDDYSDENGNMDKNDILKDEKSDVLEILLEDLLLEERDKEVEKLKNIIENLKPIYNETILKKYELGMTHVAIAKEEGVSETAIRKRLKTIFKIIKEIL